MRVKLFTHTDLDGVGCAILAYHAFKDVDVSYCDYGEINEVVSEFIDSKAHYDFARVYITDISVNADVAEKIDRNIGDKAILLDHHSTAKWLNQYGWAKVMDQWGDDRTSGTLLFQLELARIGRIQNSPTWHKLYILAEMIRRYDTWEWTTKYNDEESKRLNDLLHILGRDRFVNRFVENPDPFFTETEKVLLDLEQERIKVYTEQKEKEMIRRKIRGYNVGIVFAERCISQLGNELAKRNKDLDFIVIINVPKAVSYRGIKNDIHLGEIAKIYGGGGHPKAAGSPLDYEIINAFIDSIFNGGDSPSN